MTNEVKDEFPMDPVAQLVKMRRGNRAELFLEVGDLKIPCRILSYNEEASTIANARMMARKKTPEGAITAQHEAGEVMRQVLLKATNVDGIQYIATKFLNDLSGIELDTVYDAYLSLMRTVNPKYEEISENRIAEMIVAVKKKEKPPKGFFSWELAAIGKFFLEQILEETSRKASGPG